MPRMARSLLLLLLVCKNSPATLCGCLSCCMNVQERLKAMLHHLDYLQHSVECVMYGIGVVIYRHVVAREQSIQQVGVHHQPPQHLQRQQALPGHPAAASRCSLLVPHSTPDGISTGPVAHSCRTCCCKNTIVMSVTGVPTACGHRWNPVCTVLCVGSLNKVKQQPCMTRKQSIYTLPVGLRTCKQGLYQTCR